MTGNYSDGDAGKKQKGQCDLSLPHARNASLFENNSRQGDGGHATIHSNHSSCRAILVNSSLISI